MERHLHDKAIVNASINVDRDMLAVRSTHALNFHGPQHESQLDEEHVVCNVSPSADPPAETKGNVAFIFGIRGRWL